MRVHGDKVLRRRSGVGKLNNYRDKKTKDLLKADFQYICGYCGKDSRIMHEKFHIDHFVPVKIAPERKEDYYNLVLSCPKCNLIKSSKWPTGDKNVAHDELHGFIDPTTEEYDRHIERDERGYIQGKTILGKNVCENFNFHIRRTDLYWKIYQLYKIQEQLEYLYDENKLTCCANLFRCICKLRKGKNPLLLLVGRLSAKR